MIECWKTNKLIYCKSEFHVYNLFFSFLTLNNTFETETISFFLLERIATYILYSCIYVFLYVNGHLSDPQHKEISNCLVVNVFA